MKLAFTLTLLIQLVSIQGWAVTTSLRYNEINSKDGLSDDTVLDLLQDRQGYMWFATQDGLNRYDGYHFEVFRHDPRNDDSISDNYINGLFEDSKGFMWIATANGLNRFSPTTNKFERFYHSQTDPYSLGSDQVSCIYEDHLGHIWLGTENNGISVYSPNANRFIHYRHDPHDDNSLSNNSIQDILMDKNGVIWIATRYGGVNRFNQQQNDFTRFMHDQHDPKSLSHNNIFRIFQHSDSSIWFASHGGGLNQYIAKKQHFIRYRHDPNNQQTLSDDHIWSIVEDQNGHLLIGTFNHGLNRLLKGSQTVVRMSEVHSHKYGLSGRSVISSYVDKQGLIWHGIRDVGINILNQEHAIFNHYQSKKLKGNNLADHSITSTLQIKTEEILLIAALGGLYRFNHNTGHLTTYVAADDPHFPIFNEPIDQIMEDSDGQLWIAFAEQGLAVYQPEQRTLNFVVANRIETNSTTDFSEFQITSLVEDLYARVWIGTNQGLFQFDPESGNLEHFLLTNRDVNLLSDHHIHHLLIDDRQRLWISSQNGAFMHDLQQSINTHIHYNQQQNLASDQVLSTFVDDQNQVWFATDKGLSRLELNSQQLITFDEEDGLIDRVIYGIREDRHGILWLMTQQSLIRFDPQIIEFSRFTRRDGLQGEQFNLHAMSLLADGQLIIAGINGFNVFDPLKIVFDRNPRRTVITHFRLANLDVPVGPFQSQQGETTILTKNISYTDTISLAHQPPVLSFEFTSFEYYDPQDIQFAYRLVGFDQDWIITDHRARRATYTNLSPGQYRFEVKSSNKNGVWDHQPTVISLQIKPRWWLSKIAKFLWLGIFFLSVILIYRNKFKQIRKQKTALQLQVSRQVAQVIQQKRALETSYHDIKILSSIGQKISASLDLDKVLWAVYEDINKLMDGTIFGIGLIQRKEQRIKINLALENDHQYQPYYRSMTNKNQFPVWCIEHDEVVFVNDLELDGGRYLQEHEYQTPHRDLFFTESGEIYTDFKLKKIPQSFIYVPIKASEKILGFLSVQSFNKHAYSEVHVDILKTLAAYTGPAIVNAKEHQKLLESRRALLDSRKELIESDKMALLGALTAGIAHEINNPTHFVHISATELETTLDQYQGFLRSVVTEDDDQAVLAQLNAQIDPMFGQIKTIKEGISRIKTIMHDLRSYTHLDCLSTSKVSICENLSSTIHLVQTQFADTIEFATDFIDNPYFDCYASQLNQVYMNLLINACDAIKDKQRQQNQQGILDFIGKVVVECRSLITHIEITIKDNGNGMSESTKNRIFEPFFSTKTTDKGIGLGLAISYGIIKKHQGDLTVISKQGIGTAFKILLPIKDSDNSNHHQSLIETNVGIVSN